MLIQLNADKNLVIHEAYGTSIKEVLTKELGHFSGHISRLEVHLSDENGGKGGPNDKRCLLEARIENLHPVSVTADGDTHDQSIKAASHKLKHALETVISKMKSH